MINKEKLQVLIQEVWEASEVSSEAMGLPYEGILHPPAKPEDIATFEQRHGWSFPPSYRLFLSLHNGWEGFRDVWTLIGISGAHTEEALERIQRTLRIFEREFQNRFSGRTEEKMLEFESAPSMTGDTELDAHIYLPKMLHFGTDFAGSLLYFHPSFVDSSGEMPVIYRGQKGEIVATYDTFPSFLEATSALLTKLGH